MFILLLLGDWLQKSLQNSRSVFKYPWKKLVLKSKACWVRKYSKLFLSGLFCFGLVWFFVFKVSHLSSYSICSCLWKSWGGDAVFPVRCITDNISRMFSQLWYLYSRNHGAGQEWWKCRKQIVINWQLIFWWSLGLSWVWPESIWDSFGL